MNSRIDLNKENQYLSFNPNVFTTPHYLHLFRIGMNGRGTVSCHQLAMEPLPAIFITVFGFFSVLNVSDRATAQKQNKLF